MSVSFVLVNPQMGENIGFVARAMANFSLNDLRIVNPRDGWPNIQAVSASAGAIEQKNVEVRLFNSLQEAVADCHLVLATTARARSQAKLVYGVREAAINILARDKSGLNSAIVFGAERSGLSNEAISITHGIITFPVNPVFSSLNLGQAALIMAYELFQVKDDEGSLLPFVSQLNTTPAKHEMVWKLIEHLQAALISKNYFMPIERAQTMQQNLHSIILRMNLTDTDVKTLFAIINTLIKNN